MTLRSPKPTVPSVGPQEAPWRPFGPTLQCTGGETEAWQPAPFLLGPVPHPQHQQQHLLRTPGCSFSPPTPTLGTPTPTSPSASEMQMESCPPLLKSPVVPKGPPNKPQLRWAVPAQAPPPRPRPTAPPPRPRPHSPAASLPAWRLREPAAPSSSRRPCCPSRLPAHASPC